MGYQEQACAVAGSGCDDFSVESRQPQYPIGAGCPGLQIKRVSRPQTAGWGQAGWLAGEPLGKKVEDLGKARIHQAVRQQSLHSTRWSRLLNGTASR